MMLFYSSLTNEGMRAVVSNSECSMVKAFLVLNSSFCSITFLLSFLILPLRPRTENSSCFSSRDWGPYIKLLIMVLLPQPLLPTLSNKSAPSTILNVSKMRSRSGIKFSKLHSIFWISSFVGMILGAISVITSTIRSSLTTPGGKLTMLYAISTSSLFMLLFSALNCCTWSKVLT